MTPLTKSVLAIIAACRQVKEEIERGVTPGEWEVVSSGSAVLGERQSFSVKGPPGDFMFLHKDRDARFIAQVRTLTPVLLDATIEHLEALLKIAEDRVPRGYIGAGLPTRMADHAIAVLRSTVARWETANLIPKEKE